MNRGLSALFALTLLACAREQQVIPANPATHLPNNAQRSASLSGASDAAEIPGPDTALVLPGLLGAEIDIIGLRRLFGSNVRVGQVPGPEGTTAQGATLFADDPTRRAYLYFHDGTTRLALFKVTDRQSGWTLDSGVRIGMSLSHLLALNGKPIKFVGFDWDYGGYVSDWNGGDLAPEDGERIRRGVRLGIRPEVHDARTDDEPSPDSYPVGEGEFSSDDRTYPRLGKVAEVSEISVAFPGEDGL